MLSIVATRAALTLEPVRAVPAVRYHPWFPVAALVFLDACALCSALTASFLFWNKIRYDFSPAFLFQQWPLILVFFTAYRIAGLYCTAGMSPVEELRRAILATSGAFLALVCLTFLLKSGAQYSRGATILAWAAAVVLVPAARLILRPILGRCSWFARPVAILGAGRTGQMLVDTLRRNPALALSPVVAFDDDPAKRGRLHNVPVVSGLDGAPAYCKSLGIDYAIIAMPGLTREDLLAVMRRAASGFSRRLLVPDLFGVSSVWVEARDLGGVLGLEIRDNLLRPAASAAKRALDLALILSSLPFTLPLLALIALLVKLTSRGPVLYGQRRVGRYGKTITIWKFRTMVRNADAVLHQHLEKDWHLRAEWLRDHKLRKDPRITAVGRFLRRASLDELPQLWNVLTGELSLVGPRPIVTAEIEKFGSSYECYTRVLPGITGPWQVSGRNNLAYDERVRLNEYYVRNWSVWLDLYILFRTVRVVLTGHGSC